ncbi:MAG TPA: VWA domain-containing protein [Vicinamibacterales bacterium]|nr:VWA domain-containing protein [Vicinamibacterales bacterium]
MKCLCLMLAGVLMTAEARGQATEPATDGGGATSAVGAASPGAGPVFRSGVDLVALNVVVTDTKQKFVNGLLLGDFSVFEDGVRQDVSFFAASNVPLDLAILLDTSASMAEKMPIVRQAATGFLGTLRQGDRVMVVDIKDVTHVLQPLGPDVVAAHTAIQEAKASGGTSLYNALYMTLKELSKGRGAGREIRRQAIVVLSDGVDTSSVVSFDDLLDVAKDSGIATYTITLRSPASAAFASANIGRMFDEPEFAMKSLAQETGARSFFPTDIHQLKDVYGSIATELANQYAIGYMPKNLRTDGVFRRIMVRVSERPDVRTRTRSGYTPPRARTRPLE